MGDGSLTETTGAMTAEDLRQLVQRAERGDDSVLPELRRLLAVEPELWRYAGDMARIAEDSMIELAAGPNLLLKESLRRKLAELKAHLAGPTPSHLDQLLAERVAICWLAAAYSDAAYAQGKGKPAPAIEHARRRQDSAGRRYAEAIKLLATVRRLLGPAPKRRKADLLPPQE